MYHSSGSSKPKSKVKKSSSPDLDRPRETSVQDDDQFTAEEIETMKRRLSLVSTWPSIGYTNWLAKPNALSTLNFFHDDQLNVQMRLLLSKASFRSAVILSIFIFFGNESFDTYYLPNDREYQFSGGNLIKDRPPQPKFKLFHRFWQTLGLKNNLRSAFRKYISYNCNPNYYFKRRDLERLRRLEAQMEQS